MTLHTTIREIMALEKWHLEKMAQCKVEKISCLQKQFIIAHLKEWLPTSLD